MKVLIGFLLLVAIISISWTLWQDIGKSGFRVEALSAKLNGPLTVDFSKAPAKNSQPEQSAQTKAADVKINISSAQPSLIILNSSYSGEKVNFTGWKVKTSQGEFVIPQGVEKYNSYIPQNDIYISPSQTVYLVGAKSPLGANYRTNKCFGYLNQGFSCPSATKIESISNLTPYCQNYLSNCSYSCQNPNYSQNLKIATDYECVNYINRHFSYAGCFNDYSNSADFLGNTWYIYVGSKNLADPLHDTISLYNPSGILISQYSY